MGGGGCPLRMVEFGCGASICCRGLQQQHGNTLDQQLVDPLSPAKHAGQHTWRQQVSLVLPSGFCVSDLQHAQAMQTVKHRPSESEPSSVCLVVVLGVQAGSDGTW